MSSVPSNTWAEQLRDVISSPLGIVAMSCVVGLMAYMHVRREYPTYDDEDYEREGHVKILPALKNLRLTKQKLEYYDSHNAKGRFLVALLGTLYDVSSAPQDFGPNGNYEMLTGTDILWYIRNTARFESRDFNTYLDEWKNMLEDHFHVAGELISERPDGNESDGSTVYDSANEKDDCPDFKDVAEEQNLQIQINGAGDQENATELEEQLATTDATLCESPSKFHIEACDDTLNEGPDEHQM